MVIDIEVSEGGGPYKRLEPLYLPGVPRIGEIVEYRAEQYGEVKYVNWLLDGSVLLQVRG